MNSYFRRQLADYVCYHRDPWNCAMHVLGIVVLFLGAVLPLSSWPVPALGAQATVATIAVLPVLIYWFLLDAGLGTAIVGAAILLLLAAAIIVSHTTAAAMWSITAGLIVIGVTSQIVGHRVFERRQPALVDNPAHLLLGPMFVMAKLFIALGFRHDLAVVIEQVPEPARHGGLQYSEQLHREPHPHT
ncbi:MAG TPA: Mpo1-like protein [Bradyrhizobium sp.]